ncbi:MAG: hypothetical protein OXH00_03320 [Candidatus Poribacteria bacterium]|nr:hypothetical protein [Candidatus Poribacteria bacterium]
MLKRFRTFFTLLLVFGLSAMLMGDASEITQYFPKTLGSYWVYEDPDGNELTRRVVEDKEIAGEMYHAFSYEPVLENPADYDYHIHPNFYQVGEERVTFLLGDEVEKAVKAHLTEEMKAFQKILEKMGAPFIMLYNIEIEAQDPFYALPIPVTPNEKWKATQIKAKITMQPVPPQDPPKATIEFTIVETGTVVSTENVETPAGTFKDCLKIEYRTETEMEVSAAEFGSETPGESLTTLWVAPNIGIVKFHQKAEDIFLKTTPMPPGFEAPSPVRPPELNLELKRYEVK